jgi:hypothetical protein
VRSRKAGAVVADSVPPGAGAWTVAASASLTVTAPADSLSAMARKLSSVA